MQKAKICGQIIATLICFVFGFVANSRPNMFPQLRNPVFLKYATVSIQIVCTKDSDSDYQVLTVPSTQTDARNWPAWNISGYWDENVFVVHQDPYQAALRECKTRTSYVRSHHQRPEQDYEFIQPSKKGWSKFVIHESGEIMPGYDDFKSDWIQVDVYCTRNNASDFVYLYKRSPAPAETNWKISGSWDKSGKYFFVSKNDYDIRLGDCKKRKAKDGINFYEYIQPKSSGWLNFKIQNFNQIMPGFNGKAPTGHSRILCTRDDGMITPHLYNSTGEQLINRQFIFWYIKGFWDGNYFVVHKPAYEAAFEKCKCNGFKYAQPADTTEWYRFALKQNKHSLQGRVMPGYKLPGQN